MRWKKQIGAGSDAGSGSIGEVIDMHGSRRAITVQSTRSGVMYDLGIKEIQPDYVGREYQYFERAGSNYEILTGRLFIDYPSTGGGMSGPFHGVGDTRFTELIPPVVTSLDYVFQNDFPGIDELEGLATFKYDWEAATFGGSNLFDLMIADLRKNFPTNIAANGGGVYTTFNLYAGSDWDWWRVYVRLDFSPTYRDSPYFDNIAVIDGLLDVYTPAVLDDLAAVQQVTVSIQSKRPGKLDEAITIRRQGVGFGVATGGQWYEPGVSGFVQLGPPDIRLNVLPTGIVTLSSGSRTRYFTTATIYASDMSWPNLQWHTPANFGGLDELNPYTIAGNGRYWRFPGYATGG